MEKNDADTPALIPSLALNVAEWFPELGGRSIAVSEIQNLQNRSNIPNLPLAATALISEEAEQGQNNNSKITIVSDLLLMFMFSVQKYLREDGSDSPFYAFYDYERIRNRLLSRMFDWRTPGNGSIRYVSMDVESDEYAVYMSFRFQAREVWCLPDEQEPLAVDIIGRVVQAAVPLECCDPCIPPPEEDGCEDARVRNPYGKESGPGFYDPSTENET